MRLLDLFSGIGGFSLAAQWVWGDELEIVAFCEIDKFCQKVLKRHWPDVPIIKDVRDVKLETLAYSRLSTKGSENQSERPSDYPTGCCQKEFSIDLLTGGFPCQPFSCAGKRKGKEDDRFLWPEMFRVIQEIRPRWVVAENVAGIVRMELDNCLSDLEGEGYSTQAVIIPAASVNAPHRRDRVWIVAYSEIKREITTQQSRQWGSIKQGSQDVADTAGILPQGYECGQGQVEPWGSDWWSTESRLGGMVDGIPNWLHEPESVPRVARGVKERVNRLKSLGNAIVPQIAEVIFRSIKKIDC